MLEETILDTQQLQQQQPQKQHFKKTPNRLFYTVKLSSSVLKEHNYEMNITFDDCLKSGLIISLSDSQMLKTIRDITHKEIDRDLLETWYQERDMLKKRKSSQANKQRIKQLQSNIYNMMYIPEYITVTMDSINDYKKMYSKGLKFNGHTYYRGSCSASQARVSTIVFIDSTIKDEVKRRLDCGRNQSKPLAPSKYNAYFGLYSSASKKVTKPRYCIVPDYCDNLNVDVNWSIETDWDLDDILEKRTIETEFNRFDGSGLISPQMAIQWGKDLGEDYTPCQFCIRTAFTKGLVNEFDFVEWCRDELEGIKSEDEKYIITDIYGEKRDLREIDVIISEGMAKLWNSWESQQEYDRCCVENGIDWRITKYAPKKDKECSTMNYQYLQTLNLSDKDIDAICKDTVDYIQGVTYEDVYYTLLFCMGQNINEDSMINYMRSSDNYWLKSMILENDILKDKYSKSKIRDMIITRIEQACLGRLLINGNYQAIVPDSYAFCQWITGQPVTGILEDGEFYSKFWEEKGVKEFACARSPMCWRAEYQVVSNGVKERGENNEAF